MTRRSCFDSKPPTPPDIPGYRLAAMSLCDHGHILSIRYEVIDPCEDPQGIQVARTHDGFETPVTDEGHAMRLPEGRFV